MPGRVALRKYWPDFYAHLLGSVHILRLAITRMGFPMSADSFAAAAKISRLMRISDVGAIAMKALVHRDDVDGRVGGNGPDGAAHAVVIAAGNIEAGSDIDGIARPHVRREMQARLARRSAFPSRVPANSRRARHTDRLRC